MLSQLTMSRETRRDIFLIVTFSLVSAIGVTSVFWGCRFLAWIAIAISDLYLLILLLLASLRAEDDAFLDRHPWITHFFPRKTSGILVVTLLALTILSGFAGLYVGAKVFRSVNHHSMPFTQASSSWDSPTTRPSQGMGSL